MFGLSLKIKKLIKRTDEMRTRGHLRLFLGFVVDCFPVLLNGCSDLKTKKNLTDRKLMLT